MFQSKQFPAVYTGNVPGKCTLLTKGDILAIVLNQNVQLMMFTGFPATPKA